MHNALLWGLVTALGLLAGPAFAAPTGIAAKGAQLDVVVVGLELRGGSPTETPGPPETSPPAVEPKPTPVVPAPAEAAPVRSPVDTAVDIAIRHQREGVGAPLDGAAMAALGAPLSGPARHVIEAIARDAGIEPGQLASVADTPRDQAYFLADQLFDPTVGDSGVRARYGLPGALAAESYRRIRDVYQVLDLSAAQRQSVVAVIEDALIAGNALGQVDDPDDEMIDVDPGPHADRGRFERAIAAHRSIARCIRPAERTSSAFYMVAMPRRGPGVGRAVCHDAWTNPAIAAAPTARFTGAVTDSGGAGFPAHNGKPAAGFDPPAASIEGAPISPAGPPMPAQPSNDASSWTYVVTSGPRGPVVTRVPQ